MDKLKDEFDELDKLNCKFDELDKLKDDFDELDKLNCKFDELDKLKDEFDDLDKLNRSELSLIRINEYSIAVHTQTVILWSNILVHMIKTFNNTHVTETSPFKSYPRFAPNI